MPKYSASLITHSFWFSEFQQYVALINAGESEQEIREKAIDENYFKQSTAARNQDLLNVLKIRFATLDQDYFNLVPRLDTANQKIVNLIMIMNSNRLFSEFMYDVYRDELVLGDSQLHDYETMGFFNRKQVESEQIAAWTDQTIARIIGAFKTFVREAGLMEDAGSYDQIKRPMLSFELEDLLQAKGANRTLAVLLGR